MPWLKYDQPEPEVTLKDGVPTARLEVDKAQTEEWRSTFNAEAADIPASAIDEHGRTLLLVKITALADVYDVLDSIVALLKNPNTPPRAPGFERPRDNRPPSRITSAFGGTSTRRSTRSSRAPLHCSSRVAELHSVRSSTAIGVCSARHTGAIDGHNVCEQNRADCDRCDDQHGHYGHQHCVDLVGKLVPQEASEHDAQGTPANRPDRDRHTRLACDDGFQLPGVRPKALSTDSPP